MRRSLLSLAFCWAVCGLDVASAADLNKIDRRLAKEPTYDSAPLYGLLVFGKQATNRIWIVVDGKKLYVDRDQDRDLTDEVPITTTSSTFSIADIVEKDSGAVHPRTTLRVYEEGNFRISATLANKHKQTVGYARAGMPKAYLARQAGNAPIVHLNGPLGLETYRSITVLPRKPDGHSYRYTGIQLRLGSPGLGMGTFAHYSRTILKQGSEYLKLEATLELPGQSPESPLRQRLDVRGCAYYVYSTPVTLPAETASGLARVRLSIPELPGQDVRPAEVTGLILGQESDIHTVRQVLETTNAWGREEIIRAAGRFLPPTDSSVQFLASYVDDPSAKVRERVFYALRSWLSKNPKAVEAIRAGLFSQDPEVRANTLHALSISSNVREAAFGHLVAAATDPAAVVRRTVMLQLGTYTDRSADVLPLLMRGLEDDDQYVRAYAIRSWAKFKTAALGEMPRVRRMLVDPAANVQVEVANAIAKIDADNIVEHLLSIGSDSGSEAARKALLKYHWRRVGGKLKFDDDDNIASMKISDRSELTAYDLRVLSLMPKLADLEINNSPIGDAALPYILACPQLQRVVVWKTSMTNLAVKELAKLPRLESLGVGANPITDDALVHVSGLHNLRFLSIGDTQITDAGLSHVSGLTNLTFLGIAGTQVKGPGLVHLKRLTNLNWLNMFRLPCDSSHLRHIAHLSKLETLSLFQNTKIDDTAVDDIIQLQNLKRLYLNGTSITTNGRNTIQRSLQQCKIYN